MRTILLAVPPQLTRLFRDECRLFCIAVDVDFSIPGFPKNSGSLWSPMRLL